MKKYYAGFELSEIKWLTVYEAAQLASVSTHTIRYHIDKGNLVFRYAATKSRRYFYLVEVNSLKKRYPHIVQTWEK